jgi:hypothetical protein
MSTLEQRMQGGSSIPWIPQPDKAAKYRAGGKDCNSDELLMGVVVDHFTRDNFNGDGKIDVVVLALDTGGEVAIHCSATVLANQMRSAAPAFGERIGVKYLGVVSRQGHPDYHEFLVHTDHSKGGPIHWAGEPDPIADYVEPVRHEYQAPADTAGGTDDSSDIPF